MTPFPYPVTTAAGLIRHVGAPEDLLELAAALDGAMRAAQHDSSPAVSAHLRAAEWHLAAVLSALGAAAAVEQREQRT